MRSSTDDLTRGCTELRVQKSMLDNLVKRPASLFALLFVFLLQTAQVPAAVSEGVHLTDAEKAYLAEHPVIRFHAEESWPPFNFIEHGETRGFVNDYVRAVAEHAGLSIEFVSGFTWSEFVEALKNHEIDVIANMKITPERREFALFTERSTVKVIQGILTLSNNQAHASLEGIEKQGLVLAVVRGFFHEEVLKEHFPSIALLLTNDLEDSMRQVIAGKADAAIGSHAVFDYLIAQHFYPDLISTPIVGNDLFAPTPQHMGISKRSPELKSILDKAMAAFPETQLVALRKKWLELSPVASKEPKLLNGEERAYLARKEEISMCVDPDWMPLEAIEDGEHVGIASDFIQHIQASVGVPITLVKTKTWAQSIQFAKSRDCDILSLAMETPSRREYLSFTRPYLNVPLVLATKQEELFVVDVSAVRNKSLGIVNSYAYAELLRNRYPDLDIVDVKSIADGLSLVEQGKLYGFIDTLPTIGYEIQRGYPELKIAGKFDDVWELGIGVRNDSPLLLSALDKAIASIPHGMHQEVLNRWISVKYEKVDFPYVKEVVGLMLFVVALLGYRHYVLRKYHKKVIDISKTDSLTGCANRLKLDEYLEYLVSLYSRHQQPFSVILFDLDNFKLVNDRYGHLVGDKVLVELVELIETNIRDHDLLGRWGGEEFLVVCANTTTTDAEKLAEHLRQKVNGFSFTSVGSVHVSFGVAGYLQQEQSADDLLSQADNALYHAKRTGRDKVVAYTPDLDGQAVT